MNTKVTLFFLLVSGMVIVSADPIPAPRFNSDDQNSDSDSDESYSFEWNVSDESSENNYGHQESRSNGRTRGSYFVDLPDGRRMTVTYYVDGYSGFVHDISFEGEAEYDSGSYQRYQRRYDDSSSQSSESDDSYSASDEGYYRHRRYSYPWY